MRTPRRAATVTLVQVAMAAGCVVAVRLHPLAPFAIAILVETVLLLAMWAWWRRDRRAGTEEPPAPWPGDALRKAPWRTAGRAAWSILSTLMGAVAIAAIGVWRPWTVPVALAAFAAYSWGLAWFWWHRDARRNGPPAAPRVPA